MVCALLVRLELWGLARSEVGEDAWLNSDSRDAGGWFQRLEVDWLPGVLDALLMPGGCELLAW